MKRRAVALVLAALLLGSADATVAHAQRMEGTRNPAAAEVAGFTGHRCTISTCTFFTSSYSNSRYYYDRRTCDQWKSLSKKYLNGFRTARALLRVFPNRKLHPPC